MEQQTKTTRSLAIEWYSELDIVEKFAAIRKIYPDFTGMVSDDLKEEIYLSENPQTETIKEEDVQVGGFTKGKWEIGGTSRGLNNYYIKADNQNIAQIFSSIPECEANAKRIVTCVNNFEGLLSIAKKVVERYGELMEGTTGREIADEAKAIINQIDKQ